MLASMAATQTMPAPRMDQAARARSVRVRVCGRLCGQLRQRRPRAGQAKVTSMKAGSLKTKREPSRTCQLVAKSAAMRRARQSLLGPPGWNWKRRGVCFGEELEEAFGEEGDDGGGQRRQGGC